MKKKSKIVWLLLVFSVLVLAFASCKKPDDSGSGNTPGDVDDDVIYSSQVSATLVLGEGIDEGDVSAIRTAYYRQTDKEIAIGSAAGEAAAHEIVVGKTDREISKRAYRVLELLERKHEGDVGYVIYSDGKSVAIAFDEASFGVDIAFSEAIADFVSEYMDDTSLKLESGPAVAVSFDPIKKQGEIDLAEEDRLWTAKTNQIAAVLNGDTVTAAAIVEELKGLKEFCNENYGMAQWLANLYAPEVGGFYYSNSARNSFGYLPDLVSTSTALKLIGAMINGYDGTVAEFLGEEAVNTIVAFTKNLQYENGYFYHPQWEESAIDKNADRKEADAYAALEILELFGRAPTYDIFDVKGEGAAAPASSLTMPFGASGVSAVSRVVSVSDIYIPPHYASAEAFETYLQGFGLLEDTKYACEMICSEISQYKAVDKVLAESGADYRLCDVLSDFMAKYQDRDSGLWYQGEVRYTKIADLASIAEVYNALGEVMPGYRTLFNLIMNVTATFSEEYEKIETVSNVWRALAAVVQNVVEYGDESEKAEINTALTELYSRLGESIKATKKELSKFVNEDGSFSSTTGGSASNYLGMPVAVPRMAEGDIIATYIVLDGIYNVIFEVLDVEAIPLFNTADRMTLNKTISNLGEVIKVEVPDNFKIEDFEGFEVGPVYDLYLEKVFGTADTKFEIKEDTVAGEVSKVLEWNVASGTDANFLIFERLTNTKIGANAAFFETDMKMQAVNDKTTDLVLSIRSSADGHITAFHLAISIDGPGTPIRVTGNNEWDFGIDSETLDFKKTLDVKEGEWFKLRIECTDAVYDYDYDGKNDIVYRAYINGVLVGEAHSATKPNQIPAGTDLDDVRLGVSKGRACIITLDNTVMGQCRMTYDEPAPADTDTITYEPGVITNKTKPTFGLNTSNAEILEMTVSDAVTKVLKFYTSSGSLDTLSVSPTLTLDGANAVSFETDIMIDPESDVSTLYLEPKTATGATAFRLILKTAKGGDVTISGADIPETVIGKSGEWLHIKVTYMNPRIDYTGDGFDDVLYKVYVGDAQEPVATGHALYAAGTYCAPFALDKFVITYTADSVATVCLDNTRFWQVELVADKAPEFTETGDTTLNGAEGDKSDNNGWT